MNDEIKEILEYLENGNWEIGNGDYEKSLYKSDIKMLLDYITNLQKENERLNKMCELYSKSLYCAELTDYKSRIEKAVEYINNNPFINSMAKVSIMNILRGDNDERKSN